MGELLRSAEGEFRRGLDEPQAFRELERRRRNLAFSLPTFLRDLFGWLVGWSAAPPRDVADAPKSVAPLARKN